MIKEWLVGKVLDKIFERTTEALRDIEGHSHFSRKVFEESIANHIEGVIKWSNEFSVESSETPKDVSDSYIQLNYYLTPKKDQLSGSMEIPQKVLFKDYLAESDKCTVLLGQPGAGKTTSLKYIAHKILMDSDFCPNKYQVPIVIRFRELITYGSSTFTKYEGVFDKLYRIFGFTNLEDIASSEKHVLERVVCTGLDELNALLILDGFDEYPYPDKQKVVNEIITLARQLKSSRFILTSRTVEFPYIVSNTQVFEIAPLDNSQIKEFVQAWLKDDHYSNLFLSQLFGATYLDTARRPLTLTHLLIIFNKSKPKEIPPKPNMIYSKVVELLIREWDENRNIVRESQYSGFQHQRKRSFLCKLSFYLTKGLKGTSFQSNTIRSTYLDLCESFDLPREESHTVLKELESHNGLFIRSGSNRYEFAHKSIQEYFTAEYLKGVAVLSDLPIDLTKIPDELAVLVALASEANGYFEMILSVMHKEGMGHFNLDFLDSFLNRVFLENPDFLVNPRLGYLILFVFSDLLSQTSNDIHAHC